MVKSVVQVDLAKLAHIVIGSVPCSYDGQVSIGKNGILHRFNEDELHILTDGAGGFKAIANPGRDNQRILRKGSFQELVTSHPEVFA